MTSPSMHNISTMLPLLNCGMFIDVIGARGYLGIVPNRSAGSYEPERMEAMQATATKKQDTSVSVTTVHGSIEVRCTTPSVHALMQHPG